MTQVEAADWFGVRQPDVSKMLRREFRQFSVERLLRFLVALDQDVEIVVKPHRDRKPRPGPASLLKGCYAACHCAHPPFRKRER